MAKSDSKFFKNFSISYLLRTWRKAKLKKSIKGTFIIEAVVTIPIFFYMVFFVLELMKINLTQTSIETMGAEMTFDLIANKKTSNFNEIIGKYRPAFIPADNIRWYIKMYASLAIMCQTSPYGGEEITWPTPIVGNYTPGAHYACGDYLDTDGTGSFLAANAGALNADVANGYLNGSSAAPTGTAFVLTVVCNYPFSSGLVAKLYHGGVNSKASDGGKGSTYILWARGCGIL